MSRVRSRSVAAILVGMLATPAFAQSAGKGKKTEHPAAAPTQAPDVPQERIEELNLSVGESKTLSASGVKSYSVASSGIADVRLTPDAGEFVIVGDKPGSTTLLLIKKDGLQVNYNINVFARPMQSVEQELVALLDGITGVRVRRVGARFFIEGGVSTEPEQKKIEQIAALFPGQVESLVVVGGGAADRKLNIRVDFIFVQFDRDKSYRAGIQWPGTIGGPGVASFSGSFDFLQGATTTAAASVTDQPLPGLDLAATKGWAKVLKHSTVITSNGSEARFSSGGEQNFLVATGFAAQLQRITFGTDVTVLPRYDPTKRELEVRLDAEVTDLTPTVTTGTDLPGRNISKLTTLVALKLGQSIVLSGIKSESQRHAVRGLPGLSEIPILGLLFGSHSDTKNEVEGAIYVVPSIVESIPKGAQELVDEALTNYREYTGDMSDVNVWEKNPARAPGVRTKP